MRPLQRYMLDEMERIENDWIDEQIARMKRTDSWQDNIGLMFVVFTFFILIGIAIGHYLPWVA